MKDAKFYSTDATDLVANYNEAVNVAKAAIEKNHWKMEGAFPHLTIVDISKIQSKRGKKDLRDRINRVIQKPTIQSINMLLCKVNSISSEGKTGTKVSISDKEKKIQIAKKEWKKAQAEAEHLLKAYKEEKGEFYTAQWKYF